MNREPFWDRKSKWRHSNENKPHEILNYSNGIPDIDHVDAGASAARAIWSGRSAGINMVNIRNAVRIIENLVGFVFIAMPPFTFAVPKGFTVHSVTNLLTLTYVCPLNLWFQN